MSTSAPSSANTVLPQRMLVVDDGEDFRERLAVAFRQRGYEVETACNYDEGVAAAKRFQPEQAVIDLRMPGRSGMELLERLVHLVPGIRVVVLTGFGSIAHAVQAIRLGATNFIPKPADADDILAAFDREAPEELPSSIEPHEVPSLARAEWEHIHRVLADCDNNISEAARRLGIHRRSLQRKLRKLAP